MTGLPDDKTILATIEPLALTAGRRIMDVFAAGCSTETKSDNSPVTVADRDAEVIILEGLRSAFPSVPIIAEEEAEAGKCPASTGDLFFLVDPLDGTREFVNRRTDFTVNIALVRDGVPVLGVVYAPALNTLYAGRPGHAEMVVTDERHDATERKPIVVRDSGDPITIVASRSHRTAETDAFIARYGSVDLVSVGSSLKFCMLAAGSADLYPRFGRTMQWDTAAGDAVLRAAGGTMTMVDGQPFYYGKGRVAGDADFANPHFVAEGRIAKA